MANNGFQRAFSFLIVSSIALLMPSPEKALVSFGASYAFALERWVAGGKGHPWRDVATLLNLEVTESGSIQPIDVSGQNLSLRALDRGGWVNSSHQPPTSPYFAPLALERGINGDHNEGWGCTKWVGPVWARGKAQEEDIHGEGHSTEQYRDITVILDLGAPFGVDSLSFYTREGFEDRLMRGYEIFVNEGSQTFTPPPPLKLLGMWKDTWRYELWCSWYPLVKDWKLVTAEKVPKGTVSRADIAIPTEVVRYIAINDKISLPDSLGWEIDEFEVWGKGFAMAANCSSNVIDLGQMSNFGNLKWSATIDPEASITIRTRTGKTSDPYIYYELTGIGLTGKTEVSKARYYSLLETRQGPIEPNTEKWSFWSVPYPPSGDQRMLSPGPARYFQFMVEFHSHSPLAKATIDSLVLEYSRPPVAREIVAEISPQEISPGEVTTFRYVLLAIFEPGNTGFDALRVLTPVKVDTSAIRDLKINGLPVEFSKEVGEDKGKHWFTLYFPDDRIPKRRVVITDSARVEFTFDCRALMYGTRFLAKAFDSQTMEAAQDVVPGDASPELGSNELFVKWPLGGSLITDVKVLPNPLTPNDDGVNDILNISYSLLQLTEPVPVSVTVYDLSGSPVWHRDEHQANGLYSIPWDGKDSNGQLMPPGLYIYQITAEAGTSTYNHIGTITIAY